MTTAEILKAADELHQTRPPFPGVDPSQAQCDEINAWLDKINAKIKELDLSPSKAKLFKDHATR